MTRYGLVLALLMLAAIFAAPAPVPPASANASRWGSTYLPNVTVITQDNRPVQFYDDLIKGQTVVIIFIYTSCKSICPLILARIADLQKKLDKDVAAATRFIAISIDPVPDTPAKLKSYAEAFDIKTGWTFVTGDPGSIDLIRYKLGERSGNAIVQHKNEVLMYSDTTGEWARDSAFADLGVLAMAVQSMYPELRNRLPTTATRQLSEGSMPVDPPGHVLFMKACSTCHTIGSGDKVGPDLDGLAKRRRPEWIKDYLIAPGKLRAEGDPIALQLRRQYPAVQMPTLGLADTDVEDLMLYLNARESPAAGSTIR